MRRLAALIVLPLLLLLLPTMRAEEDLPHRTMSFALRDTNAARYAIRDAKREMEAGRLEAGLGHAQRVLDRMRMDLFRVASPATSTRWRLASEEVDDLLQALSPEGRATYDRMVEPTARPLIDAAVRERDLGALERVVLRYGASQAGAEAARLLTHAYLEAGRGRDAAAWATRALAFHPDDRWLAMHRIEGLGLSLNRAALERLAGGAEGDVSASARRWLDRIPAATAPSGWPMFGGNPGHNRKAPDAGPRPQELRWSTKVPLRMRQQDLERPGMNSPDDSRHFWEWWKTWRPLQPAVDQRVAYVGNGRALYALDLFSGQTRWTFEEGQDAPLPLVPVGRQGPGRTSFERTFAPVLGKDLVYGTVEVRRPYRAEVLNLVEISTYLPRRVLVALERSSGKLRWVMGNTPIDRLVLAGYTIVSPCVLEGDVVYAVAARHTGTHHTIAAVAFDAHTGHLRWKRDLGLGQQELNLFGTPVKELAAAAPAVADDVLYLTSGLGFAGALDARTGTPLWIASYEIQKIEQVQLWYRAPLRFPDVAPSPLVVAGDLLLLAPTDGRHLHAFDRRTGVMRWRVRYPRHPLLGAPAQFLGVADDGRRKVALITGTHLKAYDLERGEPVWIGRLQTEFGEHNIPVGRGVVAGDTILVPTNRGLVRFSLSREGSFLGRDPWPAGSAPGNVVPRANVLLVAARDALEGFYSWDVIEKDLATRRRQRPEDPLVFVDAGEIYRVGGALDRARAAFEGALRLARDDPGAREARHRAERGLHETWLAAAEQDPRTAAKSLKQALRWARRAREKVEVRIRMDTLLEGDLDARVENLRAMVTESAGVRATFEGFDGDVPVRAVALLRLATLHVERGDQTAAVAALQRVLREERNASIAGRSAGQLAREQIDEVINDWGATPYAPFEAEAERLLEEAAAHQDTALLARILREFPNAAVVPETLYQLGRRHLEEGHPQKAIAHLQELLGQHTATERIAQAAADLARAFAAADSPGAESFLLAWIEHRVPTAPVVWRDKTLPGSQYVARVRTTRPPKAARQPRRLGSGPLEETLRVNAGGNWGNQVLTTSPDDEETTIALFRDGDRLVGFDLPRGRVAFDLENVGPVHRAHVQGDTVVYALPDGLHAMRVSRGETLWEVPIDGSVVSLAGAHGLIFVLRQDTSGNTRERTLIAFDVERGREVWRRAMGEDDYRDLRPLGTDLLLRQSRYDGRKVWPTMLFLDGATGATRQVLDLPDQRRRSLPPVVVEGLLITSSSKASNQGSILSARELETGRLVWNRGLPSKARPYALLERGGEVICLQGDGTLTSFLGSDGTPLDLTRIYTGESREIRPFHGTAPIARGDRLVMMPLLQKAPFHLGAWDRRTGKLAWDVEWSSDTRPLRAILDSTEDAVLLLLAELRSGNEARVHLRRIDPDTGAIVQEIESLGLSAENGFLSMASGWGTVVVFGRSGAALYRVRPNGR